MKTKIYMVRVDTDTVIGFAKWANRGLGSAILDARDLNRHGCEDCIRKRFYSQAHHKTKGLMSANGFEFEWLDFDEITTPKQAELVVSKQKCYSIEKKADGSFKVNKIDGELYDEDELKIALCKMALNGD